MEKTMLVKPYDRDVADDVFSCLFYHTGHSTEQGLEEIPSASYQLVVSALELMRWELSGTDRETILKATGIVEYLRDMQKSREWNRKKEGK